VCSCDPSSDAATPGEECISLIEPCPDTKYCPEGSFDLTSLPVEDCPAGYYCKVGWTEPIPCDPGRACTTTGLSAPDADCAAGSYCLSGAASNTPTDGVTGDICFTGHYCPGYSTPGTGIYPIPCPIGTYNDLEGKSDPATECKACPEG